MRVYNPVKQGIDQDPTGAFVRVHVPELDAVPDAFIHEPWRWPGASKLRYPPPIVDHAAAAKAARDALYALRKGSGHREAAREIAAKHGSRKAGIPMTGRKAKATPKVADASQLTLDF
jgi:deoxyribodipyrimidine photo-lyase